MSKFADCLTLSQLAIYTPIIKSDFTDSKAIIDTYKANHKKIFQCAIDKKVEFDSDAYLNAVQREQNRALRSLGKYDQQSWGKGLDLSLWSSADQKTQFLIQNTIHSHEKILRGSIPNFDELAESIKEKNEDQYRTGRSNGLFAGGLVGAGAALGIVALIGGGETLLALGSLAILPATIGLAVGGTIGYFIGKHYDLKKNVPEPKSTEVFDKLEAKDKQVLAEVLKGKILASD